MKLYADYMKERENIEVLYTDECFLSYKLLDEETAFVFDIYSKPSVRGDGKMLELGKDFISKVKKQNVKVIYGNTVTTTNGWRNSDRLLKKFGFIFSGKDPDDNVVNNYFLKI